MGEITSKRKFDIIMNTSVGVMEMGFRMREMVASVSLYS
jgi:hypothetical protein